MNAVFRLSLNLLTLACALGCQARAPETQSSSASSARSLPPRLDPNLARPDVIATSAPLAGFMRGMNLGNGLDAPSEGAWGTRLSEAHFSMVAAAGLDHVRLPVRFSTAERTDSNPPYAIREDFFQRVDWAIEQALKNKLSIMVNVHHYEEIHKDPQAHKQRFYAMWRQIAERYKNQPPQVAFEILNEPNAELKPDILNELTAEALRIIRETNPTRVVLANSYFWAAADRLAELRLPAEDANVVGQFHMYQPILFTHQGADWMDAWCKTRGVIFPGPPSTPLTPVPPAEETEWVNDWFSAYNRLPLAENPSGPRTVFEHFDHAAKWVKATSKRAYLGEFGAIDGADPQSRENYVWLVRTEAERRGIGWAYWDDGGRFKAMDVKTGEWDPVLRRALLGK